MAALHDNPDIWPTLPALPEAEIDREWLARIPEIHSDDPWATCWEYVLTHRLSDGEGAAFWTGANLVYEAMRAPAPTTDPRAEEARAQIAGEEAS